MATPETNLLTFRSPDAIRAGLRVAATADGTTITSCLRRASADWLLARGILVCGQAGITLADGGEVRV